MTSTSNPFFYIPGAGGGAPNLAALLDEGDGETSFEVIQYPGWRRCSDPLCSGEKIVSDLSREIESRVPNGPLRIMGLSLGGHFAYLVAHHLEEKGREIEIVCAIDAFIVNTTQPTPGWQQRAFFEFLELLRGLRLNDMSRFGRSRLWRAMLRAMGGKLPFFLSKASRINWLARALEVDPILKQELDMRMLTHVVVPWLAKIDVEPVRLSVPMALLRTQSTASSDAAWRARCSDLSIFVIKGTHHALFDEANISSLRAEFLAATRSHKTSKL